MSDTQVLSDHVVNETRFQYTRDRNSQAAQIGDPTVIVQGAFTGGGNSMGVNRDNQSRFELQNDTIVSEGAHSINIGSAPPLHARRQLLHLGLQRPVHLLLAQRLQANTPRVRRHRRQQALPPSTTSMLASSSRTTTRPAPISRSATAFAMSRKTISPTMQISLRASPSPGRPAQRATSLQRRSSAEAMDGSSIVSAKTTSFSPFRQNGINQQQYVIQNPTFYQNAPSPAATGFGSVAATLPPIPSRRT